jgi:uncharacterized delta-60 repeat protein
MERFNNDGSVDTSFGTNGNGIVISSTTQWINAVALQQVSGVTDEEIVVAGNAGNAGPNFFIARYLANGTLDTSFGTNGQTTISFGSTLPSGISAIAVQSNGNIVLVGSTGGAAGDIFSAGSNLALARLTVNGMPDTTFRSGGKLTSTLPSGAAVVLQPDGKIIVGGSGKIGNKGKNSAGFVVSRFTTAGALDPTFGSGGEVLTTFSGAFGIGGLALDSSGNVVAVGTTTITSGKSVSQLIAIARYTPAGKLDTNFAGTGQTTTAFPGVAKSSGSLVAIQPSDGKILVAGVAVGVGHGIVRFNTNGTLDSSGLGSFGQAGSVETAFMGSGSSQGVVGIILDPSAPGSTFAGTFVVVGAWLQNNSQVEYFTLARYFQ